MTQMSGPGPEEFYRQEAERKARASALSQGASNSSIRHYLAGLLIFGVASLAVAITIAYLPTMTAMFVALPVFAILLAGLGFLAMRARYAQPNLSWVHGGFMVAWTAAFVGTMLLLTSELGEQVPMFVLDGFLMLAVCVVAAFIAARLTRDRRGRVADPDGTDPDGTDPDGTDPHVA